MTATPQTSASEAHPLALQSPAARIRFWSIAAAFAAVHVWLVNYFVPFREVFSERPLQGIDYDLHIGQVFRVVTALEGWGKSWLYDVQLLAGQPEGTITDSGSKGWELWTYALHHFFGVPKPIAFNSFVLTIMLAGPLLSYAAARAFEIRPGGSLCAAMLTSSLWFFDSHIHWLWFVGMISWAGASCLSLLTLGLFYRLMRFDRLGYAVPCGLCLGVGLLIHPYTFFALSPPMAASYLQAFRGLSRARHACVVGIVLFALSINAYWLHNAFSHWHYILNSAFYAQAKPKYLVCDLFEVLCSGADTGVIGTRTAFRFLCLALGVAGLWVWRRERDSRFWPLLFAVATLYVIAYFGGQLPGLQQTQPYRQITPASLFTTLPAAGFVEWLWCKRLLARAPREAWALVIALGLVLTQQLIASQVLYFFPNLIPDPSVHPDGSDSPLSKYGFLWVAGRPSHFEYGVPHDPNTVELGAEPLMRWLIDNVPHGSRVLISGSMLGERLAWRSDFEVLGGFLERNVAHVDANYFREHRTYAATPAQLLHYLQMFAVQWLVTERNDFDRAPELVQQVAVVAGRKIYRTIAPINRVITGGGTVTASENLIEVRGSDGKQPVVLSYHWHEALRCKPDCRVERQLIDIDRVGFVRIPAPHPANMRIWNSYQMH